MLFVFVLGLHRCENQKRLEYFRADLLRLFCCWFLLFHCHSSSVDFDTRRALFVCHQRQPATNRFQCKNLIFHDADDVARNTKHDSRFNAHIIKYANIWSFIYRSVARQTYRKKKRKRFWDDFFIFVNRTLNLISIDFLCEK